MRTHVNRTITAVFGFGQERGVVAGMLGKRAQAPKRYQPSWHAPCLMPRPASRSSRDAHRALSRLGADAPAACQQGLAALRLRTESCLGPVPGCSVTFRS
jgi:hypothetical protein